MPTSIIPQSVDGTIADVGGTTFRAQNIQWNPVEYGANGHFAVGLSSGVMAAGLAANSEIIQFRWSDATRFAAILRIRFGAVLSTTAFIAGVPLQFDLVKCNTWTASGSGGTRISPLGGLKKRREMSASLVLATDIGVSTTAALTAGTKVLEGTPMGVLLGPGPTATSADTTIIPPDATMFDHDARHGDSPIILNQNEGFVIRAVAVPATGVWQFRARITWAEVDAY